MRPCPLSQMEGPRGPGRGGAGGENRFRSWGRTEGGACPASPARTSYSLRHSTSEVEPYSGDPCKTPKIPKQPPRAARLAGPPGTEHPPALSPAHMVPLLQAGELRHAQPWHGLRGGPVQAARGPVLAPSLLGKTALALGALTVHPHQGFPPGARARESCPWLRGPRNPAWKPEAEAT